MNHQHAVNCLSSSRQAIARYTACVFEPSDIVEIRRLPSGRSTWHQAGKLTEVVKSLTRDNQRKQHIYVSANPRKASGGTKNEDVACARCLFADFDDIDSIVYYGNCLARIFRIRASCAKTRYARYPWPFILIP